MSEAVSWLTAVASLANLGAVPGSVWKDTGVLGAVPGSVWKDTGVSFSTTIVRHIPPEAGRAPQTVKNPASWILWECPRQLSSKSDMGPPVKYLWSARNPNPGAIHTKDYKITDQYKPPVGASVEESKTKAAEWAKQFDLPSPEQQGENLAKLIARLQASGAIGPITGSQDINRGTPAPSYDPVANTVPATVKSKLPLIIGGVALVATVAALWWRFRK